MAKKKHPEGDLYLLQATWQDSDRTYRHRLIHTRAKSVDAMFEILAKEHPEWGTTDDYTTVGEIDGQYASVTVFKTEWMDDRAWKRWRNKKQKQRRHQIANEERDRDMQTIRDLVKKHGMVAMEVLAMAAEGEDE